MKDELTPFLQKISKGTLLFQEGEPGEEMYFIHSGKVRIEKNIAGKKQCLAIMEKGDFFGEMALLEHLPRTATAIIEEDAELLKIESENFDKVLKGNIEIAIRMIRKYVSRLREANQRLEVLAKIPQEEKYSIPEGSTQLLFATLTSETGVVFPITEPKTQIGRKDPVTQQNPHIDLSSMDENRSVSRRHALLEMEKGDFFLSEEVAVSNGTFINGEKIFPGHRIKISSPCVLRFGQIELRFEIPPTKPVV